MSKNHGQLFKNTCISPGHYGVSNHLTFYRCSGGRKKEEKRKKKKGKKRFLTIWILDVGEEGDVFLANQAGLLACAVQRQKLQESVSLNFI